MTCIPSIMSLHLRYRLWISEMNYFINVLRIFDDYLKALVDKKNEQEIKTGIDYFENEFINVRKEIDELRHEMHILKMKLATYSRERKPLLTEMYRADHHTRIKRRYINFRKTFQKVKTEFSDFEGKWMD